MFELKQKHVYHTKISWEKSILTIYWKSMKKGQIKGKNTNIKLSCALSMIRQKIFYIHVKACASRFLLILNILI